FERRPAVAGAYDLRVALHLAHRRSAFQELGVGGDARRRQTASAWSSAASERRLSRLQAPGQAVVPAEERHCHVPVPIWLESAVGSTLEVRSGRPLPNCRETSP